jgi:signal transduction histidine kinase
VHHIGGITGPRQVLTAPVGEAGVLVLATGPRSVLVPPAPLGRVLETGPERTTLYRLTVRADPDASSGTRPRWRREGWALRSTLPLGGATRLGVAHVTIPLGQPGSLFVRGSLVVFLDVIALALLWLLAERIVGVQRGPLNLRQQARSFQARLALALSLFFAAPATLLATLSTRQLAREALQSRDLVLERVLRDAMPSGGFVQDSGGLAVQLAQMAERVDADLALYVRGRRLATSEPLLAELGVFPGLLDADAYHAIRLDGERYAGHRHRETALRLGYAPVPSSGPNDPEAVLATVAASPERAIRERQRDVVFTLVLVTLLGVLLATGAARGAARMLTRPVAALRDLALRLGRAGEELGRAGSQGSGEPAHEAGRQPLEFEPVFTAFHRMAEDIRASQQALETARRRIETVLATVSTGVVAVDAEGRVLLANAGAEQALGAALPEGALLVSALHGAWRPLAEAIARGDDGIEVEDAGRRFEVRLAALPPPVGGRVLAITDVTASTRAARVLAWADVANQVAHAIKNPLTPLRLGIQHLQRVREERPAHFDQVLSETAARILAEIERLDAMARAFARLAAPGLEERPLEAVDCHAAVTEVAGLYRMAPDLSVVVDVAPGSRVVARRDELAEVLINLCDNARNAGARQIVLRHRDGVLEVEDDGRGIAPEHLERIFEPRFSTQSSGSGLGLAIVRRMVESWGGSVTVVSEPGRGTTFRLRLMTRDA